MFLVVANACAGLVVPVTLHIQDLRLVRNTSSNPPPPDPPGIPLLFGTTVGAIAPPPPPPYAVKTPEFVVNVVLPPELPLLFPGADGPPVMLHLLLCPTEKGYTTFLKSLHPLQHIHRRRHPFQVLLLPPDPPPPNSANFKVPSLEQHHQDQVIFAASYLITSINLS